MPGTIRLKRQFKPAATGDGLRRALLPKESDILKQCVQWLKLQGIFAFRVNSGAMGGAYKGKRHYVRFSIPGCSDILGCLPPDGRLLACECKRPGAKLRPEQVVFLESVERAGGLALVVTSLAELIDGFMPLAEGDRWVQFRPVRNVKREFPHAQQITPNERD